MQRIKIFIAILLSGLFVHVSAQKFTALEKVLAKEFSENSNTDGRWVFYSERADIEKIIKPLVGLQIPNYTFYKIQLTNYLGYHINEATCLILYDSLKAKVLLVEPLWYGGVSERFVRLFVGKTFNSKDSLMSFLTELNELMEVGSGFKFVTPIYTDSLITYDLASLKGDSYTTKGNGISSTVQYNQDDVWRKIRITIKNLKIIRYASTNPKTNEEETIK